MEFKFLKVFDREHKIKMIFLFLFLFFVSLIEILSIGSLLPIFSIIFNEKYLLQVNNFLDSYNFTNFKFENHDKLVFFSLTALFCIFTLKNSILLIFYWIQNKFLRDLTNYLSNSLFKIFINQPYEYFFNAKSSDLIRDIISEPGGLIKHLFTPLCWLIMESITITGLILFLVLYYGGKVGLILFTILIIIGIALYFTRKLIKKWGSIRYKFETQRIKSISQSFDNIKDIIIKKKINFFFKKFQEFTKLSLNAGRFSSFFGTLPKLFVEQLVIILFIIYFIYYYNFNTLDENFFSKLIFLGAILIRLIPGLVKISNSYQQIKYKSTAAKNISKFFELNKKVVLDNKKIIEFKDCIEFQNLSYKFQGYDKNVLNSLNFKIKKNQIIGIIGKTGSGKTTFLDIFLGLLKPTEGKILIDEKDCTFELNCSGWHSKIGYVSQNVTLIDDSIKKNIAIGANEDEIDVNKINEIIINTNLKKLIDSLPEGIETIVGEKGVKLSGGQIQRIGIARAIYTNPDILCLDEATSSLDYQTENEILKTLLSVKKNKTIIVIAHRLKTIENCDKIIELDNGKIKKIATPNEILKNYVK